MKFLKPKKVDSCCFNSSSKHGVNYNKMVFLRGKKIQFQNDGKKGAPCCYKSSLKRGVYGTKWCWFEPKIQFQMLFLKELKMVFL